MSKLRGVAAVRVVAQGGSAGFVTAAIGGGPSITGQAGGGGTVEDGGGEPGEPPAPPAAPVAAFDQDPDSGVGPLTVSFTDTSTGEIGSWLWDFDDGTTSNNQNPTHVFVTAGTFTVTLTVTNSGGSDSTFRVVTVTATIPAADFSGTPLSGLAPLTVAFTDASTGTIDSRLWDFGDGATSTATNPSHTYNAAGSWDVSLRANGPAGSDVELKTGYVSSGVSTGLPVGYQTPGQTHNFVVDLSGHVPGAHVITQALVTELDALLASGTPPVDGDHIAFCLPALTSTGFGIGTSGGATSGPDISAASWPDINIHLIGPFAPIGTDKTFRFDPGVYTTSSGDNITIEPTSNWASRIEFWSIELNPRGRWIVGAGAKDTTGTGMSPGPHSPLGSVIKFHQCDFVESPNSPASSWPASAGWNYKWAVHVFWTMLFFEDCRFDLPHSAEHIGYVHHPPPEDGGMRNCWIENVGSQVWQETCRAHVEPSDVCWTAGSFEGEYHGRGTTTFERVYVDESTGFGDRAANIWNNYSSGRDWVIRDCHVKMLNNPPVNGEGNAGFETRSQGVCLVFSNTSINLTSTCSPTSNYWREDDHGGTSGGKAFANYSLIIEDCTFMSNTGKALLDISSVSGTVLIQNNFFGSLDNTGGAGAQAIQFCRENISGNNIQWLHMANDADCADVTFIGNNDPTDPVNGPIGRATNPAVTRFSTPLPALIVSNAISSPLGVLAGVDSVTGSSGDMADPVVIGHARDEWVNDTTTFVEYP